MRSQADDAIEDIACVSSEAKLAARLADSNGAADHVSCVISSATYLAVVFASHSRTTSSARLLPVNSDAEDALTDTRCDDLARTDVATSQSVASDDKNVHDSKGNNQRDHDAPTLRSLLRHWEQMRYAPLPMTTTRLPHQAFLHDSDKNTAATPLRQRYIKTLHATVKQPVTALDFGSLGGSASPKKQCPAALVDVSQQPFSARIRSLVLRPIPEIASRSAVRVDHDDGRLEHLALVSSA